MSKYSTENFIQNESVSSDIHSEEFQEIITEVPSWILKSGIFIIFITMIVLLSVCALIPFVERVNFPLNIQLNNSPIPMSINTPARIHAILLKQGAYVKKGTTVALIYLQNHSKEALPLRASNDGTVCYYNYYQSDTHIEANEKIFIVRPVLESFFGIIHINQKFINKVKIGQNVKMLIADYSSTDLGIKAAKITYISNEPTSKGDFIAKVTFDYEKSKNNKIKDWMTGHVEITTSNISLLNYFANNVLKVAF